MSYETIQVTPVGGSIGVEIAGVNLAEPLSNRQAQEVHEAFLANSVVFFRDQSLSEDDHIAFARRFGPININRFFLAHERYPEIALVPSPQLVVPLMNARYTLNAANARWTSLYDALYGTDAMGDMPEGKGYDRARGARVVTWAKSFLDGVAPLEGISHIDVTRYTVDSGALVAEFGAGKTARLKTPAAFAGYRGDAAAPTTTLRSTSVA